MAHMVIAFGIRGSIADAGEIRDMLAILFPFPSVPDLLTVLLRLGETDHNGMDSDRGTFDEGIPYLCPSDEQ